MAGAARNGPLAVADADLERSFAKFTDVCTVIRAIDESVDRQTPVLKRWLRTLLDVMQEYTHGPAGTGVGIDTLFMTAIWMIVRTLLQKHALDANESRLILRIVGRAPTPTAAHFAARIKADIKNVDLTPVPFDNMDNLLNKHGSRDLQQRILNLRRNLYLCQGAIDSHRRGLVHGGSLDYLVKDMISLINVMFYSALTFAEPVARPDLFHVPVVYTLASVVTELCERMTAQDVGLDDAIFRRHTNTLRRESNVINALLFIKNQNITYDRACPFPDRGSVDLLEQVAAQLTTAVVLIRAKAAPPGPKIDPPKFQGQDHV